MRRRFGYIALAQNGEFNWPEPLGRNVLLRQGSSARFYSGYMWVTLSAEQGYEPAKELLETLQKEMTPAQVAEAQRLAREWKAKGV